MRRFSRGVLLLLCALLVPAAARAQATIAGVVRDASGGVLPGVTVEAASPALIERVRSVVTDGGGQYRIVDLRPGSYTVTFTLPGFNTVKREGVELTGSFTATVNADMQVGAVEETITVTGAAATVDVQSATRQRVMDSQTIADLPTGRVFANLAVLIPGISQTNAPDVGGALGANMTDLIAHGSKASDQRIMQNGISLATNAGGRAGAVPNMTAFQEVTIDSGAVDASRAEGGVRVNFVPREGGNTFRGNGFFGFANNAMQSSNFTQRLQGLGLQTPASVKRVWDFNPGFGGPIKQDKLWYYLTIRHQGAYNYVGLFYNKNANNPNAWTYDPDTSRPAANQQLWSDGQVRLTYQATQRNKVSFSFDMQDINGNWPFGCECMRVALSGGAVTLTSPEANSARRFPLQRALLAEWSSPLTSRVLLEAVAIQRVERFATDDSGPNAGGVDPQMIAITEQGGPIAGLEYRAPADYGNTWMWNLYYRTAASYITGSHAYKVGLNGGKGFNQALPFVHVPYSYRFNNGVPNQITLRALPSAGGTSREFQTRTEYQWDIGVYAQDKWTIDRMTLGYGLRFDYFGNTIPENRLGPVPLAPTRNVTFPAKKNLAWKDLSPKVSAVYDLFGTGKTALKTSLNRYLGGQTVGGLASAPGGAANVVTQTNRSWNDSNRDFVPNCDLLNPEANGECGRMANTNFGKAIIGSTYDSDLLRGWFHRSYNWEFSAGVQHEILPRVAVDVAYFRRWYGNFTVTDDQTVSAADFSPFSIVAPVDPRLPNGGGQTISGLLDLSPNKFGQPAQNFVTLSDTYGKQTERWNGMDVGVSARLGGGLLLQGGISTGKTTTDNCEIRQALPESSPTNPYCHVETAFLTQGKFVGAYTIPRIDVLVSGTFQSLPGPQLVANVTAANAIIAPSLGRNLSGGSNVSINVLTPGAMYGERVNQLDFRIGKVIRFGSKRVTGNFDLYNATNADTVLIENSGLSSWRRPSQILQARLAKFSVQWDF